MLNNSWSSGKRVWALIRLGLISIKGWWKNLFRHPLFQTCEYSQCGFTGAFQNCIYIRLWPRFKMRQIGIKPHGDLHTAPHHFRLWFIPFGRIYTHPVLLIQRGIFLNRFWFLYKLCNSWLLHFTILFFSYTYLLGFF